MGVKDDCVGDEESLEIEIVERGLHGSRCGRVSRIGTVTRVFWLMVVSSTWSFVAGL